MIWHGPCLCLGKVGDVFAGIGFLRCRAKALDWLCVMNAGGVSMEVECCGLGEDGMRGAVLESEGR